MTSEYQSTEAWVGRSHPGPASHLFPLSFLFVIEHMMPLCMVISWVYSVAMTIQHIVAEKEHRLKEVGLGGCRRRSGASRPLVSAPGTFAAPPHR